MFHILTLFSVATTMLAGLISPLTSWHTGTLFLGGSHQISANKSISEDVSFYFAQVTIEEGATVDGHIFLFSSTLDLAGHVTEEVHAFESDLMLRDSAKVDGEIDEEDLIHWTLLLPTIAQLP